MGLSQLQLNHEQYLHLHQMIYRTNFDEKMANPTTESEIKGKFIALIAIDTPVTDEALQMQVEKMQELIKRVIHLMNIISLNLQFIMKLLIKQNLKL